MAACASVEIVTRSGIVFLLEADPSAWVRAAHSVVGLLVVAHIVFNALPGLAVLPHHRAAGSAVVRP